MVRTHQRSVRNKNDLPHQLCIWWRRAPRPLLGQSRRRPLQSGTDFVSWASTVSSEIALSFSSFTLALSHSGEGSTFSPHLVKVPIQSDHRTQNLRGRKTAC